MGKTETERDTDGAGGLHERDIKKRMKIDDDR